MKQSVATRLLGEQLGIKTAAAQEERRQVSSDLGVGALGDLSEVVLGSSRDAAKEDLLRDASSQGHTHAVQQLFFGVQVLLFRQVLGVTQTLPSGDDGHLQGFHKLVFIKFSLCCKLEYSIITPFVTKLECTVFLDLCIEICLSLSDSDEARQPDPGPVNTDHSTYSDMS